MTDRQKKLITIISPLAVIAAGFLTALAFSNLIGAWAFLPVTAVYWGTTFLIAVVAGRADLKRLFAKPAGSVFWPILSLIVGLIPLPIFLLNTGLLKEPGLIVLWIAFALVNPFFEELFWRGFLLEALPWEQKWLRAVYAGALFIASHPLMWGVFSVANRSWMLFASLAVMTVVWSLVYYKTKSLWWCVLSHILVDVFNLAVFVMLNLYTAGPPA